jgi:hypothetical protein
VEPAAERVVIAVREMIRFGVGVSRRPDILKITLSQGRLVFRKSGGVPRGAGRLARAKKKRADCETEKREMIPVTQREGLLTVIHNRMQEYFSGDS